MRVSRGTITMKIQDKDGPDQHTDRTAKVAKGAPANETLGKPTGNKVAIPPLSHLQKSGLRLRPTCIVHPLEMDE